MNKLKNLVRRLQLVVLILLVMQVSIKTSFAQNQLNYSPTINFTYTNEKAYTADINNDNFNDIVLYNTTTGLVTALNHNGNNNAMEFDSIFSITLNGETLLDVKQIDQSGEADLITYKAGLLYDELKYYPSTGSAFSSGITLTDSLPNADYQFGTLDINNDGVFDIYALNQANNTLYYYIVNTATLPLSFSTLSMPAIPSNSTVHIFTGHFQSAMLNDLCFVIDSSGVASSNYTFQVIQNNSGTSLSIGFSTQNNIASPNQQFYAGKFTNDDFTDIAIYPANQHVYVLHNLNGLNFDSILLWQSGITQPPNKFTFNAGNYKGTSMYNTDELMLLETYTDPQFNSDLGRTYIDTVSYTATAYSFGLNEMSIAPCFGNPIVDTSTDFHLVNGDFNSDGSMDMVLYNPTKHILKVGIMQSVTIPSSYVQGYCWPQSAAPGKSINFYISGTPSSTGTIDIFRYVSRDDKVIDTFVTSITLPNGITTQITNPNVVISGCGWNISATLLITNNTDWPSGYYAARVSNWSSYL